MSYLDVVDRDTLFSSLRSIDKELANRCRVGGCQKKGCGGPLHAGNYSRKPRGEKIPIPEEYCKRQSLCCGWCRSRAKPESCLFFGRRVYWGVTIILVTAAAQGFEKHSIAELCRRFGVSRRTIGRWVSFFARSFPQSNQWQKLRGRVSAVVQAPLPRSLLEHFLSRFEAVEAVRRCLLFLAGGFLNGGLFQAGLGREKLTQKMPNYIKSFL